MIVQLLGRGVATHMGQVKWIDQVDKGLLELPKMCGETMFFIWAVLWADQCVPHVIPMSENTVAIHGQFHESNSVKPV